MNITVEDYSSVSFALFGETKNIKDILQQLGGSYNRYLKGPNDTKRPGWIFPKSKKDQVLSELSKQSLSNTSNKSDTSNTVSSVVYKSDIDMKQVEKYFLQLTSRIEALENEVSSQKRWILDCKLKCESKGIDFNKEIMPLSSLTTETKSTKTQKIKKNKPESESEEYNSENESQSESESESKSEKKIKQKSKKEEPKEPKEPKHVRLIRK